MDISIGSYTFRVEILISIIIVFWIMFGHLLCGCCRINIFESMTTISQANDLTTKTEGFTGNNKVSYEPEFAGVKSTSYIMNPSTWSVMYSPENSNNSESLSNGELDMFANTKFSPECCPNTYSSSSGCACLTVEQYSKLNSRFGNNVPYSEY